MTIVISDASTINVSRSVIDDSRSINYKNIMIVNHTSRVVRMTAQFGASLADDSRSVIYNRNMFIKQATWQCSKLTKPSVVYIMSAWGTN
jgi:hypothetical protein